MPLQPVRLSFGTSRTPTKLTWILYANSAGAPLVLPDEPCEITVRADGRFDGAALAIEITYDGVTYATAAAPMRAPGQQRLTVQPKALRPVVSGAGECTAVVVSLEARRSDGQH